MFLLRKRLLCLLIAVTIVSVSVLFVGVSPAFASSHSISRQLNVNGGGCNNSGDGKVRACVAFTSANAVLPDAYVAPGLHNCSIEIELYYDNPGFQGDASDTNQFSFDCNSVNHLYGYSTSAVSKGDRLYALVTLWYDGGMSRATSPIQYI